MRMKQPGENGNGTRKASFVLYCIGTAIVILVFFGTIFIGWTAKDFEIRDARLDRVESDVATMQAKLDRIEKSVLKIEAVVVKEE